MFAFNLRLCILIVIITLKLSTINAQFGGFLPGGGFSSTNFASQNTNFNQNRRGFGVIAGFGGASDTNFNSNSFQGGATNISPFFRQETDMNEIHARYASPYDLPTYSPPKPHYAAPNPHYAAPNPHYAAPHPHSYPSPAPSVPCPSKLLISCFPQTSQVPCSPSPSY